MSEKQLTPKAEKKRKTILEIALKVFAKEGFRNADVQIIADMASVGKGTVYRHFGNKEQLFLATARYCLEELGEYVAKSVGDEEAVAEILKEDGTIGLLKKIALSCAEFYQKRPQTVEIMIQERAEFREGVYPSHLMFRTETREGLDQLLRGAIDSGELRQMDPSEATNAFADLIFGSAVNGCLEGGKSKLVERLDRAMDILLYGFAARPTAKKSK